MVRRVESVVNRPMMMNWDESNAPMKILCSIESMTMVNSPIVRRRLEAEEDAGFTIYTSPQELRDAEDAYYSIQSKVEFLNRGYRSLRIQAAETKHCCSEMAEQLKLVMSMLGKQLCQLDRDEATSPTRPGSSFRQSQVQDSDMEQSRKDFHLGYRYGDVIFADRDNLVQENKLAMFDGKNPSNWIVRAEAFLKSFRDEDKLVVVYAYLERAAKKWFVWVGRHGGFSDWGDFKQKLLNRFEHVTSSVKGVSVSSADSQGHESVKSLNLEYEAIHKICSLSPVQETVVIQEKSSSQNEVLDQENTSSLIREHNLQSTTVSHLATSCFLQLQQTEKSVFEDSVTIYRDAGNVTRLVTKPLKSINKDKCVAQSHCGSDTWQPAILDERFDHLSAKKAGNGKVSRIRTLNSTPSGVHHLSDQTLGRVPSKQEKLKWIKTWRFKFKSMNMLQLVTRQGFQLRVMLRLKELRDATTGQRYLIQGERLVDVALMTSEQQKFVLGKKFLKSWHFKYKPKKGNLKRQHNPIIYFVYLAASGRYLQRIKAIGTFSKCWQSQFKYLTFYVNQLEGNYSTLSAIGRKLISKMHPLHLHWWLQQGGLKGQCAYVVKSICVLTVVGICFKQDLFLRAVTRSLRDLFLSAMKLGLIRVKREDIMLEIVMELSFQKTMKNPQEWFHITIIFKMETVLELACFMEMFLHHYLAIWHCCHSNFTQERLLQLQFIPLNGVMMSFWLNLHTEKRALNLLSLPVRISPAFVRKVWTKLHSKVDNGDEVKFVFDDMAGKQSGLQPYGSDQRSSQLILHSSSLRSSLFSRGGVYMRILIYWFRVGVLIWLSLTSSETGRLQRNVKRQKEKEELNTQSVLQVMIHHWLKGRRIILWLCIKRHLLHMQIYYNQIWKKYYKARRFKYKERTGRLCYYISDAVLGAVLVFLGIDGEISSLVKLHNDLYVHLDQYNIRT